MEKPWLWAQVTAAGVLVGISTVQALGSIQTYCHPTIQCLAFCRSSGGRRPEPSLRAQLGWVLGTQALLLSSTGTPVNQAQAWSWEGLQIEKLEATLSVRPRQLCPSILRGINDFSQSRTNSISMAARLGRTLGKY